VWDLDQRPQMMRQSCERDIFKTPFPLLIDYWDSGKGKGNSGKGKGNSGNGKGNIGKGKGNNGNGTVDISLAMTEVRLMYFYQLF
jgi:hypothetical protein